MKLELSNNTVVSITIHHGGEPRITVKEQGNPCSNNYGEGEAAHYLLLLASGLTSPEVGKLCHFYVEYRAMVNDWEEEKDLSFYGHS